MPLAGQKIRAIDFSGQAKVSLAGSQSISSSANTKVQFDTVEFDDHGFWDSGNFRFVIPSGFAGLYSIELIICFAGNSTGSRAANIEQGGERKAGTWQPNNGTSDTRMDVSTDLVLGVGDFIEGVAFQTSGAALDVLGTGTNRTHLSIIRYRPL